MDHEEFMREIGLSEACISAVKKVSFTEEEVRALPRSPLLNGRYYGDSPDRVLALFVRFLAEYGERAYAQKGVMRTEWLETMSDIAIWSRFLYEESGEIGLRETHWLAHLVRAELFRLGRLQFIPRVSETEICFDGATFPAGTPYCEVHVPADGKLLPREVDLSFARAKRLFAPSFFSCDSWLLSPGLERFVNGGNMLSFASRFTLVQTDANDRSAERYIFSKIGDPRDYIVKNSFAEGVKRAACKGIYVGSALGYCIVKI